MKILILSQRWYPDAFGGSEHVASEQAGRLAARGHQVTVITERIRESLPYEAIENNVRIIRFGSEKQFSRYAGSSRTDRQEVPKIIKKLKESFDAAIIHHPFVGAGFFKAGLKIPSLYVFHSSTAKEVQFEGMRKILPWYLKPFESILNVFFVSWIFKIEREVLNKVDKVGIFSEFSRKVLLGFIGEGKVVKLFTGIDQEKFKPAIQSDARNKLGLPLSKKILLTVRRFTPRMGVGNLIRAMETIPDNVQLLIVGEGPLKPILQREIERKKLQSKATLVGAVPLEDLPLYYQSADLFVLPTEAFEGLGMSTLEALASGLPVVGTPAGATPEVIAVLDPTLITNGTKVEDLANGIKRFLSRTPPEQNSLRLRARLVAERYYTWEKAIDQLEKIIGQP